MNNETSQKINEFIKDNYGKQTNKELSKMIEREFGEIVKVPAIKKRWQRIKDNEDKVITPPNLSGKEYETYNKDGSVEAQKIVNLRPEDKQNPRRVLEIMGYDPNNWEISQMTFSNWQQHTKMEGTKSLYSVKFKIKPLSKTIDLDVVRVVAKEVIAEEIKPLNLPKKNNDKQLDHNKMMEQPAIELHLGKMAHNWDTGEDYDQKIAKERFEEITTETLEEQLVQKCGTLFLSIGQDFFNSDTVDNTTTRGTPQQNDLRWKKMFKIGLELYIEALLTYREHFNKVDVQLCQGNHDVMSSFYLYIALEQYFKNDDIIKFSDNYKTTQCYTFGKCAIFTNHGDNNYKRLVESIPVEFPMEWAMATYRELHLGHLHSEHAEEKSGLLTRRIGSPSGTDDWHYQQRYIGAIPKHQLFVWDKEKGLQHIRYINFDKKKQKIKQLER